MRTKGIVLGNTAPPDVYYFWPFRFITNTVFPMIGISEAAAGPAQVWNFEFFQGSHHVISHTGRVWNFRRIAYIKTAVNATAQMLGKMPVNMAADFTARFAGVHAYDVLSESKLTRKKKGDANKSQSFHKMRFAMLEKEKQGYVPTKRFRSF